MTDDQTQDLSPPLPLPAPLPPPTPPYPPAPLRPYALPTTHDSPTPILPLQVVPDDPTDEVFYSTLYLRTESWTFDGPTLKDACGDSCKPSGGDAAQWRVGDRCLSCTDVRA